MYKQFNEEFDWAHKAKELDSLHDRYTKLDPSDKNLTIEASEEKLKLQKKDMDEQLKR